MKHLLKGAVLATALLASSFASAATVQDGNFASGNINTSWTATGNAWVINEHNYDGINGVAQPGTNFWAVFGGSQLPGGSISQSIATTVGQLYTLNFTYGAWGDSNGQSIEFSIGNLLNSISVPVSELTKNWNELASKTFSFQFTADSTNSLVTFKDTSGSSINADGVLTNVSIQAVPGPEAGAGLGALALGGLVLYMKRRRKEEATVA